MVVWQKVLYKFTERNVIRLLIILLVQIQAVNRIKMSTD